MTVSKGLEIGFSARSPCQKGARAQPRRLGMRGKDGRKFQSSAWANTCNKSKMLGIQYSGFQSSQLHKKVSFT